MLEGRFVCQSDMRLLMIHGMGRTPFSLALLGRHLSQHGHTVRYFGYAAFHESFDQIVARLIVTMRATADQYPYALIGHSLGGILARGLTRTHEEPALPSGDACAAEPVSTACTTPAYAAALPADDARLRRQASRSGILCNATRADNPYDDHRRNCWAARPVVAIWRPA
jgi:alpha-beta hydrolase superfamily lysophospholipase